MKISTNTFENAKNKEYTVTGSWLCLFLESLESYNYDSNKLLQRYKIDPKLIENPDYRVDARLMSNLWSEGLALSKDESFGLRTGAHVHPGTFGALGLILCTGSSLKEQFGTWLEYGGLFSTAGYARLEQGQNHYRYQSRLHKDRHGIESSNSVALDATAAAIIGFCRMHFRSTFTPIEVRLPRKPPLDKKAYQLFYGCPVTYEHKGIEILIDKKDMEANIPHGNQPLKQLLESHANEYLSRKGYVDIIRNLKFAISRQLSEGAARQENLAQDLHMSVRSLQRHLQQRGTSFSEILDDVRRENAMRFIEKSQLNILDIAERLGFSTASNFSRNFKQWTGYSPLQYRQRNNY